MIKRTTATYLICKKCGQRWALLDDLALNRVYAEAHDFLRSHSQLNKDCTIKDINVATLPIKE